MGRHDGGWIKIHYSLFESDIAARGDFTLGLFIRLLAMANWKEGSAVFNGKRITLYPGQLITGLSELSPDRDYDPHMNKARAALDFLESRQTIAQQSSSKGRLITILNWVRYQMAPQAGPQADHMLDHKQASALSDENDNNISGDAAAHHKLDHKLTTCWTTTYKDNRGSLSEISVRQLLPLDAPSLQTMQKDPQRVTAEEVDQCTAVWGETLKKFKIDKDPRLNRFEIARLIQAYGLDRTKLALLGAGFEEKTEDYDPGAHVGLYRFQDPKNLERFENLGAREITRRKKREAEISQLRAASASAPEPAERKDDPSLLSTNRKRVQEIMASVGLRHMPKDGES